MKGVHIVTMIETIEVLNTTSNKMVCPFRSYIVTGQHLNEEQIPEQYQVATFPECQYQLCPYFESSGKNNMDKCARVNL